MYLEGEFLFDNQLVAAIEGLINHAKEKLVLISPFIDLDPRIKTALKAKIEDKDFSLVVVLGKNEGNYNKSIKKESLDFLMQFPSIEIRYDQRLHAKFYKNDFDYIITSMNLYNFSLANNIEFGVRISHASKGLLGKVGDASNQFVDQGVNKIKEGVFGSKTEVDPIEKFQEIINNSKLLFKSEAKLADKGGLGGLVGMKKLDGRTILVNELKDANSTQPQTANVATPEENVAATSIAQPTAPSSNAKLVSASKLSKELGIPAAKFKGFFEQNGYIKNDEITDLGKSKGLVMMKGQYGPYVGYPEGMEELKLIKG